MYLCIVFIRLLIGNDQLPDILNNSYNHIFGFAVNLPLKIGRLFLTLKGNLIYVAISMYALQKHKGGNTLKKMVLSLK